jgi:hypothetical protein
MASARSSPGRIASRAPLPCVGLLAAFVAASSFAPSAHADEPVAPEVDTNPSTLPPPAARPNLLLVGAAFTVGWYGVAVGTSYLWDKSDSASALRIPVAGPYMALAKTGCSSNESSCNTFTVFIRTVLTSLSLVGQTGGILAMLEGAFVRTGAGASIKERPARVKPPTRHVAVVPTSVSATGAGVAVFGEF